MCVCACRKTRGTKRTKRKASMLGVRASMYPLFHALSVTAALVQVAKEELT